MSARSWLLSLLFPVLSILIITVIFVIMITNDNFTAEALFDFIFALIFGYGCCGIAPITMIIKGKIDISDHIPGKIILFIAMIFVFVIFVASDLYAAMLFVMPALILIAEGVFAAVQKTDFKTKLCVFLSSPSFVYVGFMIDIIRLLLSPD